MASRPDLDEVLHPLLSTAPEATGMALAARHGDHETVLVTGTTDRAATQPVTPDTRFELGSTTKTFTALLLADMAHRGEVRYDDPVDHYLPPGWRLRQRAPITLQHLATHTSGLPRLPLGIVFRALPTWFSNPYQTLGPHQVRTTLGRVRLRSAPGARCRYSNFGIGLLGWLLAEAAHRPFENLLAERVLGPLCLTRTGNTPTPQATGHWHGSARPPFSIAGLPAAGALRSTARDMLRYLTVHLVPHDAPSAPLAWALTDVARPRVTLPCADTHLGLVWFHRTSAGHDLLFHPGATRGFTAFAGFSPQTRTALVALVNSGATARSAFIQHSYDTLQALAVGSGLRRPHGAGPD